MMKIIIDTFGADAAADVIIRGALKALTKQTAYDLILVTDPNVDLAGFCAEVLSEDSVQESADAALTILVLFHNHHPPITQALPARLSY